MDGTWILATVSVVAVVYFAGRLVHAFRARRDYADTDKLTNRARLPRYLKGPEGPGNLGWGTQGYPAGSVPGVVSSSRTRRSKAAILRTDAASSCQGLPLRVQA